MVQCDTDSSFIYVYITHATPNPLEPNLCQWGEDEQWQSQANHTHDREDKRRNDNDDPRDEEEERLCDGVIEFEDG